MNWRAQAQVRNITEKSENTLMWCWGEKKKKATLCKNICDIKRKKKNQPKISIRCLTWILPQNFETESLTNHIMFVLTCAKCIYTQQIHAIICSSRQTYLTKNVHFIYLLSLKKRHYIKPANTFSPSLQDKRYAIMISGCFRATFIFYLLHFSFLPLSLTEKFPWQMRN